MTEDECGCEQFRDAPDVEVVGRAELSLAVVVGVSGDAAPAGTVAEANGRLEPGLVTTVTGPVEDALISTRRNSPSIRPGDARVPPRPTAEVSAVTVGMEVLGASQPPAPSDDARRAESPQKSEDTPARSSGSAVGVGRGFAVVLWCPHRSRIAFARYVH